MNNRDVQTASSEWLRSRERSHAHTDPSASETLAIMHMYGVQKNFIRSAIRATAPKNTA